MDAIVVGCRGDGPGDRGGGCAVADVLGDVRRTVDYHRAFSVCRLQQMSVQ